MQFSALHVQSSPCLLRMGGGTTACVYVNVCARRGEGKARSSLCQQSDSASLIQRLLHLPPNPLPVHRVLGPVSEPGPNSCVRPSIHPSIHPPTHPSTHPSRQVSACWDALHSDHSWQFRWQLQENIHALSSFTRHMTCTVPMV